MACTKKLQRAGGPEPQLTGRDLLIAGDVYNREDKGLGDVEEME
jgi:hypothetical protein